MYRQWTTRRSGFTLIEVLIVTVIIGILAAAVLPHFTAESRTADAVVLRANLASIKKQVDVHYHRTGSYPTQIEPEWFAAGRLPRHPQNEFGVPDFQVADRPGVFHPNITVLSATAPASYWYNVAGGIIRARVTESADTTKTLDFYNYVNRTGDGSPYTAEASGGGS